MSDRHPIQYVWSRKLQVYSDQLPANQGRSSLVHSLHRAIGLLDKSGLDILEPDLSLGCPAQLTRYHTEQYIGALFFGGLDNADPL